ncbi:MAG: hypothetical protein COZ75_01480 [Flavobacteriaceae bacterium CG_4_8_14_3_um_filter_34_10]|nr:hypothetical protein [Flavobacteriia bacterium]OIP49848.1 MAG: hypothetical protein AUK33_09295 [Flavobacteriaceae bacterium CG2_30_34_30]PIQ18912.1 MAG: hypothetical protein COW66_03900 [Flavobacteriaceae bacterium CG18_big_fil_WC_8_21_14_2_50_34_36]PIV48965.1 MAG: hypothetical protein COS19_11080 [Flavobacteriaceae bacterium CG02_land_8_20_14_3_00_34_13]PIX10470.1 MAG: hypothetical protein COZ75_01480 [Flavobacteriaceae bacterium CG_4_8_14_3_um_filter_34_10]PIZ08631.1 MAG: hypothetical pr
MPYSKKIQKFYQNLGKLFYAIAAIDNTIREEEVQMLKNIIKDKWLPLDDFSDTHGTDSAYQIEIVFDWLEEQQAEPNRCFDAFKEFKKEHDSLFPIAIKELIWNTAEAIASSFAGKNKSEVILLAKLKLLLKE